ncbi:hypothetical protein [Castellaniella ginsengisoli]|uniref:HTH HARE-type domain-containing protein n=1 Tax=Castellaniella ginsengisoli TaxID=546114 RepID=A0AB39D851_9BURK
MAKDPYLAAKKKIEAYEQEILKLKSWIETYDALVADTGVEIAAVERPSAADAPLGQAVATPVKKSSRAAEKEVLINAVVEILEHEQPLPTKAIFQRLSDRGIDVGGAKPEQNLTNYLSRAKNKFFPKRGEGWSLLQTQHSAPEEQQNLGEPEQAPVVDPADGL